MSRRVELLTEAGIPDALEERGCIEKTGTGAVLVNGPDLYRKKVSKTEKTVYLSGD